MQCPTGEYSLSECNSWDLDYVEVAEKKDFSRTCIMEIDRDKIIFRAVTREKNHFSGECEGKFSYEVSQHKFYKATVPTEEILFSVAMRHFISPMKGCLITICQSGVKKSREKLRSIQNFTKKIAE